MSVKFGIALALAAIAAAPGRLAAGSSAPVTVNATANVTSSITLAKVADLNCGAVKFDTLNCDAGNPSYAKGSLTVTTNNTFTLLLNAAAATTNVPITLSQGGSTFTVPVSLSAATGPAGVNTNIDITGGAFSGLNIATPPGVYTGSFTVTAANP